MKALINLFSNLVKESENWATFFISIIITIFLSCNMAFCPEVYADTEIASNPWTISGIVTENGIPLKEAKIMINSHRIIADSEGYYSSQVTGDVTIIAYTPAGEFIGEKTIKKGTEDVEEVGFDFTPCIVTGVITENGMPVNSVQLHIDRNTETVLSENGKYTARLQEGDRRIFAVSEHGEFIGQALISLKAGEIKTVNFDFTPGTITGMLTKEGIPVKGAKIYVGLNAPVSTDTEGRYTARVVAGEVKIYARSAEGELTGQSLVIIEAGKTITLDLEI